MILFYQFDDTGMVDIMNVRNMDMDNTVHIILRVVEGTQIRSQLYK